jgi:hypothetical protein
MDRNDYDSSIKVQSTTKIVRISYPQKDLSTQLIDVMSFVWKWNAMIEEKELTHISKNQTLSARTDKPRTKLQKT